MKHFIYTRFNLQSENWKTAKDGSPILTDEWLEERFVLFEKYCFPAVINQSNKRFYWLIFFEVNTPDNYRERIEKITSKHDNITPLYIPGMRSLKNAFSHFISEKLDEEDEFIITTRLDNDDAIHRDFVATIQSLAVKKHDTVIDLRKGYQMDLSNGRYEYRNYENSFNPFISLVESVDTFNTVASKLHNEWENSDSIIIHKSSPMWIEVIHKRNKLNQPKVNIPLIKQLRLLDFGIEKELKGRSAMYVFINNFKLKNSKILQKIQSRVKSIFGIAGK